MNLPARFAGIAQAVGNKVGAPYYAAQILQQATPGYYDDDEVWVPGTAGNPASCRVQILDASEYMKANEGFADGEARFVILRAGLTIVPTTDDRVEVLDGPRRGLWLVSALSLDSAGIGWTGKGRRA
jgi:hypothetical protein